MKKQAITINGRKFFRDGNSVEVYRTIGGGIKQFGCPDCGSAIVNPPCVQPVGWCDTCDQLTEWIYGENWKPV